MIALALALLTVQASAAESLLAAGDVQAALKLARKAVEQRPRDAKAHFLLGRVHYARPVIGRYPALEEFKKAARLDPHDPAPLYWQMKVGFFLRSDEGDYMAREALLRLFAVTPDYLDAWDRFQDVYRNPKIWRRAERALATHGENSLALERRAELLLALEDGRAADSLLAIAVARGGASAAIYLLRTEAAFSRGDRSAGFAWHDSALARADRDSSDVLWSEAWLIASPGETARHDAIPAGERRTFYERFWHERDPNLLTQENERLPEHYARRAHARRTFRLLHPQRSLYHSKWARVLAGMDRRRELAGLADQAAGAGGAGSERIARERRSAALGASWRDSSYGPAFRSGLTPAGLVFLRHGAPDRQAACTDDLLDARSAVIDTSAPPCSFLDFESWVYYTPTGPLSVRFRDNEYLAPVTRAQDRSGQVLLETDRSTLPAPLAARAWSALFRSADLGLTDVYYRANGDSAAAVLWDTAGQIQPIRVSGPGLLQLSVPPGPYHFGLDVDSAGQRGRWRRDIRIPHFSAVDLGLSSLVVAPSAVLLDREAALHGMPVDLVYAAGTPLATYVEIYGLTAGARGRSRYHLRYAFEPVRSLLGKLFTNARAVVLEFGREIESSTSFERLIIEPGRLPAGRYRVTLSVTDLTRNVKSESVALEIEIR
ncbi:MAG: hypothetical protein ACREMI_01655 [Gemmatimonadales bacterium]